MMANPVLYTYDITLVRCIDGDTIQVMVDRGWNDFSKKVVRLARVDCKEIRGKEKEEGLKAKQWVEQILTQSDRLTMQSIKLDGFGRSIAEVWYWAEDEWVNLSDELLRQGWAQLYGENN